MPVVKGSLPRCFYCGEPAAITVPKAGGFSLHVCLDDIDKIESKAERDEALLRKAGLIK